MKRKKIKTRVESSEIAQHSSSNSDWGTPVDIVEASREVMERIDLDPASNAKANKRVRARRIYTTEKNGLRYQWRGRVLLNPPGGKVDKHGETLVPAPGKKGVGFGHSSSAWWLRRLVQQYEKGNTTQAIFVAFSMEVLQTVQKLGVSVAGVPMCIPSSRLKFIDGTDKKQPTHANAILYFGKNKKRFKRVFGKFGDIHNVNA